MSYGQHLTLELLILWVQWSKVEEDEVIKVIAPRECKVLYWIEFKFERRPCFDAENWIFQGLGNILYSRYHHSIRPGQEPLEICRVTFEVIIHSICWESDKLKDRRNRLSVFTWTGKFIRRLIRLYLIVVESDCSADPGMLDLLLATPNDGHLLLCQTCSKECPWYCHHWWSTLMW